MPSYPQYIQVFGSGGNIYQGAYDGYSVWIPVFYATTRSLVRMRASDGAYLNTAGAVVATLAEATISVSENLASICTDGTYLYLGSSSTMSIFRRLCSDGSQVGGAITTPIWVTPGQSVFAGGYAWFAGSAPYIFRVSPGGGLTSFNIGANVNSTVIKFDGTDLWIATDHGLKQVSLGGTVLATYLGATTVINSIECAGSNIWVYYSAKFTRIRKSDGAWIDANGNVSATEVQYGISTLPSVGAIYFDGADVWLTAGTSVGTPQVTRFRGTDGVPVEALIAPYGGSYSIVRAKNDLWFITGPSMYNPATAWRYQAFSTPNLTNVTPRAGSKVGLTFDSAVGITGPTIGPKVGPINVSGVTQVDANNIDLALDIHKPVTGIGF
jgi:hypothetical protein